MKNKFPSCLIIITLLTIVSCEEPDDEVGLRGELIGSIETFNEFDELLNDHRGMKSRLRAPIPV